MPTAQQRRNTASIRRRIKTPPFVAVIHTLCNPILRKLYTNSPAHEIHPPKSSQNSGKPPAQNAAHSASSTRFAVLILDLPNNSGKLNCMERWRLFFLLTVAFFLFSEATSLKITDAETGNLERPTSNFIRIGNLGNNNQTAAASLTTGVHPLGYRLNQVILKMGIGTAVLPFSVSPPTSNIALFHSSPSGPCALRATPSQVPCRAAIPPSRRDNMLTDHLQTLF